MFDELSGMPDLSGLNELERQIFDFVLQKWPTTAMEVAENFKEDISTREAQKRLSSKYNYYLKKLVAKNLLLSKKT